MKNKLSYLHPPPPHANDRPLENFIGNLTFGDKCNLILHPSNATLNKLIGGRMELLNEMLYNYVNLVQSTINKLVAL